MNKHVKLAVSLLFIVLIVLAAAITRFYSNTGRSTTDRRESSEISRRLAPDNEGSRIFSDSNGMYGVIDSGGKVVIAPEWYSLSGGNGLYTASSKINGTILTGCIDGEGNVIVPLIFSEIKKYSCDGFVFNIARAASDGTYVVFDSGFLPCFASSWDSAELDGNILSLTTDMGRYEYSVSSEGFIFRNAEVDGSVMNCDFTALVTSGVLLSKLDPSMLEKIISGTQQYLGFAYTDNTVYLSSIGKADDAVIEKLFPEDTKIVTKSITGISNVYIYADSYDDSSPRFTVSVTADTAVTYNDEGGKPSALVGKYTAAVEFRGDNVGSLVLTSAGFREKAPAYPAPQSTEETEASANAQ